MKKILVVDDDEGILSAFELLLTDAGYEVSTSTRDGDYVSRTIKEFDPDAIILDVLLSGSDGREICKKLKSNSNTKSIPIIMISAHPDARETVFKAGANDFLAKPFDMNTLLHKIERYTHTPS